MSTLETFSDKPVIVSSDPFISSCLNLYERISAIVELCQLFDCSDVGERILDMFVKSGPLGFRGDGFKWSLRMSIGKVFVEEVVCMVVDDGEALDQ
jgi:hypothetical protein